MNTTGEKKRGRPRKMWLEGVQAAMTTRNLEPDQWRNRGIVFGFRKTATAVKKKHSEIDSRWVNEYKALG